MFTLVLTQRGCDFEMVGVNESESKSNAEKPALDLRWSSDRALTSEDRAAQQVRRRLIEEGEKRNWKPLFDARAQGQVDQWTSGRCGRLSTL